MTPVYFIAQIKIENRNEYQKYIDGFWDVFSEYEGEFLVLNENPEIIEGEWPYTRTVVIRFPSSKEAKRWYESLEYQELSKHRLHSSKANIVLVEGLPVS